MAPPQFALTASSSQDSPGEMMGKLSESKGEPEAIETAHGPIFLGTQENGPSSNSPLAVPGHKPASDDGAPKPPRAKAPKIKHTTNAKAADGGKDSRKKIGVGEVVTFESDQDGLWIASSGSPITQATGKTFVWKAPNRAKHVTIKVKAGKKESSVKMEVVEPDHVKTKRIDEIAYAAGTAGAGMHLHFDYHPMSVSFSNVEAGEVSGPASGITGYFNTYTAAQLRHHSGDHFIGIGAQNRLNGVDEAAGSGFAKPWSNGGFHWIIPNRFRVAGEGGAGKVFDHMTQAFSLKKSGHFSIHKGGSSVGRNP
jgi:hypothetical protein